MLEQINSALDLLEDQQRDLLVPVLAEVHAGHTQIVKQALSLLMENRTDDCRQYLTEARMDRLRSVGYYLPFRSVEEGVADYISNHLSKDDPYL